MGQGRSLLALTVIKNVKHECGHQGCNVKLDLDQIKEHEENCTWRLVICPGSGKTCTAMVPLCTVLTHARNCDDCGMTVLSTGHRLQNNVHHSLYLNTASAFSGMWKRWRTVILQLEQGLVFFVRLSRKGGVFMIDVVMKGSKADCEEFRVKASILDAVSGKSMFEATFQPRYGFLVIQGGQGGR